MPFTKETRADRIEQTGSGPVCIGLKLKALDYRADAKKALSNVNINLFFPKPL